MSLLNRAKASLVRDWPSYSIIALVFLIQLFLVTRPLDFLLTNVLPDDAFYYFQIARHIVQGAGPTFDGVELTNGFHPLWMLVLLPLFHFFSVGGIADVEPVRVALGISVFLNVITGCIVLAILARFTPNTWIRAAAVGLYALNPFLLFESINGLETSLALLLTSLFFWFALSFRNQERSFAYGILGLFGGLMMLARIDMVFFFAVFLVWLFLTNVKNPIRIRNVLIAGIVATLVMLPWFIWNFSNFGMLLTSASNSNSLVSHMLIVQDHGSGLLQLAKAVIYNFDYQIRLLVLHTGSSAFFLFLLGAATVLIATGKFAFPRRLRELAPVQVLFLGFLLLFGINVGVRFWAQSWYFVTFGIFVSILFVTLAEVLLPLITHKRIIAGVLVLFVLYAFGINWSKELRDKFITQREMYAAAQWRNDNLPENAITGSFNAGIEGYFSRARVVNLDGLVNNSAYKALRQRRLLSYIRTTGITTLADYDIYFSYRYRSFFETPDYMDALHLVTRISLVKLSKTGEGLGIYHVDSIP